MPSQTGERTAPNASSPTLKYDLLALDLDGTLINSRREVSQRNIEAIRRARAAGLKIAVCTGRGLVECRPILDAIDQTDPVVVAGGAIVACPVTSRTLHRFSVEPELVAAATASLLAHDHPVLILKDPLEAGYDYLVVVGERRLPIDPVTRWWFDHLGVRVRYVEHLADDEHPEHTVRFGACGIPSVMARMKQELHQAFGERISMHHFPAVVSPQPGVAESEKLHVLEVFGAGATKWSAIQVLAGRLGIEPTRIAAIGDEVNDVAMIRAAALGVAMGNAVEQVRAVADRHTLKHDDDGVAHALDMMVAGHW